MIVAYLLFFLCSSLLSLSLYSSYLTLLFSPFFPSFLLSFFPSSLLPSSSLLPLFLLHINQVGNNTIIRGVSGGERKRTNIGIELITDPSLLFVDEPTSGLDAFRARKIINILKRMCEKGRTVICTIHQPSSDIFSLFDRVLLMVDGQAVYHGTREEAFERFGELGYPCPQYSNPADHFSRFSIAVVLIIFCYTLSLSLSLSTLSLCPSLSVPISLSLVLYLSSSPFP